MGTYHQYCPISRASEILAERWTPLIVRNLLFGAETFNAIARGVPAMSRSLLSKRLTELAGAGVVEALPKADGRGHRYRLTAAGVDLAEVIDALGQWGEKWVDVTSERSDPGFALWAWASVQANPQTIPQARTVVALDFVDQPRSNRYYWLLAEAGRLEVCYSDPGEEPQLWIRAESLPFVNWHRGVADWNSLVRDGAITVSGDRRLARAFPSWNLRGPRVGTSL